MSRGVYPTFGQISRPPDNSRNEQKPSYQSRGMAIALESKMNSARFLRMAETSQGVGFLYHLSVPFFGSHHVFVTRDHLVYQCSANAEMRHDPWYVPDAATLPEILTDLGYRVDT